MSVTTLFSLLVQACGLSHREAAEILKVRPDTVKSWSAGRNRAPDGVLADLAALASRIEIAVSEALTQIEAVVDASAEIELGASQRRRRGADHRLALCRSAAGLPRAGGGARDAARLSLPCGAARLDRRHGRGG